jgi:DNA processing protein
MRPGPDEETVLARAYLLRVAEPGSLAIAELLDRVGPVEAATRIRSGDVDEPVRRATAARRDSAEAEADLVAAERIGLRLVTPESPDWPHFGFAALYAAQRERLAQWRTGRRAPRYGGEPVVPVALWVRGPFDLASIGPASVAVVGARSATAYGEHIAGELGHDLAERGLLVVSGGAFGIDAAAHRGVLAAGAPTVLVAANGLDHAYPRAHAALFERIAADGLLLSESPPGAAPLRSHFLSRNRLIAALGAGTVVVEAAARSGALNTAAHCALLGHALMAVPGPVTSPLSVGCHALLRHPHAPATMVTSAADVMAVIGPPGAGSATEPAATAGTAGALDGLDPVARAVAEGFPARGWVGEAELSRRSGVDELEVVRALPILRAAELIESGPDGYRRCTSRPARTAAGVAP